MSFRDIGLTLVSGESPSTAQNVEPDSLSAMSGAKIKELILKKLGRKLARVKSEQTVRWKIEQMCTRNSRQWRHLSPASGGYWTIIVTMIVLVAIPIFGWYVLGETKPR